MNVEERVRRTLEQRAEGFEPSGDHLDELLRRARSAEPAPARGGPHMRRIVLIAAVFVLFIAAMVPLWDAFHGDASAPSSPSAPTSSRAPLPSHPASHPPAPSHSPSASSGAPACTASQLSAHAVPTDGAAGSVFMPIILMNTSANACSLSGYPTLRFIGRDGADLGLHATHDPVNEGHSPPSPMSRAPFVLMSGARAWFLLSSTDIIPPCAHASEIEVTPPGGTGTLTIHADQLHRLIYCTGFLKVTAATPSRLPH